MPKKLYSADETAKKFELLPQEIKDFLYSFEMTSIITKIGERNTACILTRWALSIPKQHK
jgi:hypothetical protein